MERLTEDTIQTIKRIHSAWMDFEVAGEPLRLIALCAEDIELQPPDGPPVLGRSAVLAQLTEGRSRIHAIEISDLCLDGSNDGVSLTADYKTTYSLAGDPTLRQAAGRHSWRMEKRAGRWLVVLVSWSPSSKDDL